MTSYYVYYRVDPTGVEALRERVATLFQAVEKQTGVRGRWMRRPDDSGTYMEIYEDVGDEPAFEAALAQASAAFTLARKTERFIRA